MRRDKLRKDDDGVEWQRIWVCSREGFWKKQQEHSENCTGKRITRQLTRIGCNARLKVTLDRQSKLWKAIAFNTEHNHELASSSELQFMRSFREVPDIMLQQARSMRKAGIRTMNILDYMAQHNLCMPFLKKDIYNRLAVERNIVGTETYNEGALEYLTALAIKDDSFYC